MKEIGSIIGPYNRLVALSEVEFNTLLILAQVAGGMPLFVNMPVNRVRTDVMNEGIDLSPALNAIEQWVFLKDKANSLRAAANDMDRALDGGDPDATKV